MYTGKMTVVLSQWSVASSYMSNAQASHSATDVGLTIHIQRVKSELLLT